VRTGQSASLGKRGAALLITLLLIGFLALCLSAFFLNVGGSRKRATVDREHARARLFADLATQEAIAKIVTGFSEVEGTTSGPRGSVTASPGLMEVRYYDAAPNRGTERGAAAFANNPTKPPFFRNPFHESYGGKPANPRWIPLFSWKWFAPAIPNLKLQRGQASGPNPDYNPAAVFDLNTTKNPFYPGQHYLTGVPASPIAQRYDEERPSPFHPGEAASDRPLYVQWIPVLKDPKEKPSKENPMVGRYAYWVDVENTKVNLLTSSRPFRQSEFFGVLSGEPDGDAGPSAFRQTENNPFRMARLALEGSLPRKSQAVAGSLGTFTADGVAGQGSNSAGRAMRDLLLGWRMGNRPFAADNSLVDWDYFAGLRPAAGNRGEAIAFDDLIGRYARELERKPELAFNSWAEVFSLLDPALQQETPAQARLVRDSLRRVLGNSTTIHGYDDERDPLGKPKIDFLKFQIEAKGAAGANGSPNLLKQTELWSRLMDAKYHRAYSPGAYPNGGSARSFVSSLNRFAGNGNISDSANGEIAALQLLLNVAEATLPDSVPPHIDPNLGLVGMRSVPYVAEVATRARSAIWLLPENLRKDAQALASAGEKYNGKPMSYYLTHVVVDLAVGCVNPDPFSDRDFTGTLKLDFSWHNPPLGSDVINGPLTAPIEGRFTSLPLPGDKAGRIRVDGETVYFRLGVVPGTALTDKNYAQTLRIRGWEIRDSGGQLWHQVPIRHPRAASAPQWWQMAEQGANAGQASDKLALAAFQQDAAIYGWRAVGWFAVQPGDKSLVDRVFMPADEAGKIERVTAFVESASRSTFVERVFSRDPALGHRTGNRALSGTWGMDASTQKGHFYGVLGHTWRRLERKRSGEVLDEDEVPEDDGDGDANNQTLVLNVAAYSDANHQLRAAAKIPGGGIYTAGTTTANVVAAKGSPGKTLTAVINGQNVDSLTAYFSDPKWEKCPLWELNGTLATDDSKEPMKDTDVETPAKLTTVAGVKTKEMRLGARGFFAGAPRRDLMTSIGELGFCHSGMANFPIILTDACGWNEYQLNSPRNGPPMRMLLDLFTPGAFTDPVTFSPVEEGSWRAGNYTSNSPMHPRKGTWNLNTTIAHDAYMAIREGDPDTIEIKKEFDPALLAARVAWVPAAAGYRRLEDGADYYRGKKLEDLRKKRVIGRPLGRYSGPSIVMNRAVSSWVSMLGGDFTPGRVSGGARWGFNNSGALFFGPAQFSWNPGIGAVPYGSDIPFADFGGSTNVNAKLLTFASDGRREGGADDKHSDVNTGYLRGRFASDQCLIAGQVNAQVSVPLTNAPRFSLVPMRHFVSDLAAEFNFGAAFSDFKTPLNPRQSAYPPTTDLKQSDGNSFPGAHHATGVFVNAPIALMANQVSASANVFTIHVVAQTVKDSGVERAGIANSGPGSSDPDDRILSECWARVVVAKMPPLSDDDFTPRFQILHTDIVKGAE
jgi:hypothetical protein